MKVALMRNRALVFPDSVYVTDAAFKHAGKQCPDLRHVHVIDCPNITDHTLRAIATCRNLTTLNLADCVRFVTFQAARTQEIDNSQSHFPSLDFQAVAEKLSTHRYPREEPLN